MKKICLRIATRKSPLALWQAEYVRNLLLQTAPHLHVELLPMLTTGDKFLKDKLATIGNKGLFVKELEEALLDKRADLAVHSMKDVPAELPQDLCLAAICRRHSPFDALVSVKYDNLLSLPPKAIIGTTSLRRQSQLLAERPDLTVNNLRGNVQTRIAKLEAGEYDAIMLAVAGLERLNLQHYIKQILDVETMLPACGQGALGIECRRDDEMVKECISHLNDPLTYLCVDTERHVNARLGGNCHVPIAVYCTTKTNGELILRAKVLNSQGTRVISSTQEGSPLLANQLAINCAQHLLNNGARDLLNNHS